MGVWGISTKERFAISCSTIAFGFPYFNFEIFLMGSMTSGLPFGGGRVFILNGVEILLLIIILIIRVKLSKLTKSNLENPGSHCFSRFSASSAPILNAAILPTLP